MSLRALARKIRKDPGYLSRKINGEQPWRKPEVSDRIGQLFEADHPGLTGWLRAAAGFATTSQKESIARAAAEWQDSRIASDIQVGRRQFAKGLLVSLLTSPSPSPSDAQLEDISGIREQLQQIAFEIHRGHVQLTTERLDRIERSIRAVDADEQVKKGLRALALIERSRAQVELYGPSMRQALRSADRAYNLAAELKDSDQSRWIMGGAALADAVPKRVIATTGSRPAQCIDVAKMLADDHFSVLLDLWDESLYAAIETVWLLDERAKAWLAAYLSTHDRQALGNADQASSLAIEKATALVSRLSGDAELQSVNYARFLLALARETRARILVMAGCGDETEIFRLLSLARADIMGLELRVVEYQIWLTEVEAHIRRCGRELSDVLRAGADAAPTIHQKQKVKVLAGRIGVSLN